ncbi:hypothetical protein THAOC_21146, partial [Thalassiosira oceanica]
RSAHLQRDYSTLAASVGSAGTTMIGRVELLHGLPWWPDDGAHGTYSSLPGPHRHNWLNADGQGVDARRHVAFRSGSQS